MKLYNSLTKKVDEIYTLKKGSVSIYSCGPTVYDSVHIGNLTSFIYADTLSRILRETGYKINHVMNITDVDDKTIKALECDHGGCNNAETLEELRVLTEDKTNSFFHDAQILNIDIASNYTITKATEFMNHMISLISELENSGIAYPADDGIYFSIQKYKESGNIYGQLVEITQESTGAARIDNDEYDKDNIHDFVLWKARTENEPYWIYLNKNTGTKMEGRPGWHIECSAMSASSLGLPFDIHTGGIDLKFPHHENEIAQSTALSGSKMANYFIHNEHLLVDGTKMSKSKGNFYSLGDVIQRFDPLSFRLSTLKSKYRKQGNFTWDLLQESESNLLQLQNIASLVFQSVKTDRTDFEQDYKNLKNDILDLLKDDMNTPAVISKILENSWADTGLDIEEVDYFRDYTGFLDRVLGLDLAKVADINDEQKTLISQRNQAKKEGDYAKADQLRDKLLEQNIIIGDRKYGSVWTRASWQDKSALS